MWALEVIQDLTNGYEIDGMSFLTGIHFKYTIVGLQT